MIVVKGVVRFLFGERAAGEFAQFAITAPIMAILVAASINFAYMGFVNQAATNIANTGARAGSVAQTAPASAAYKAAYAAAARGNLLNRISISVSGGGRPGATILVTVNWTVPNLLAAAGVGNGPTWKGTTYSTFRQEGW